MNASMEIHFPGGRKVYSDYKGFTVKTDQSKEDGGTIPLRPLRTYFLQHWVLVWGFMRWIFVKDARSILANLRFPLKCGPMIKPVWLKK